MSAADSVIAGTIGGSTGGAILLGLGAASNTANDIKARGGTDQQALIGGAVAGVLESVFEKLSIGELDAMRQMSGTTLKTLLGNMAKSVVTNASEEFATELGNIIFDTMFMDELSEYKLAVKNYMDMGISEESAKTLALAALRERVGAAALSGALMGFGFGAGASAISKVSDYAANNKTYNVKNFNSLVKYAMSFPEDSASYQMATQLKGQKNVTSENEVALIRTIAQDIEQGRNKASLTAETISPEGNVRGQFEEKAAPVPYKTAQQTEARDPMKVLLDAAQKKQEAERQNVSESNTREETPIEAPAPVTELNTEKKAPGFYKNDKFSGTDEEAAYLDRLAKAAGVSIEMVDTMDGVNGVIVNGEVHLSENAADPFQVVAKHEITHHLQDAAGEAYTQYRNYVEQIYRDRGTLDQQIEAIQQLYRKNGKELSREAALDELAADYAGELIENETLIRKLAGENRNLAQRILDGIRDLIRRIKTAFGSEEIRQLDRAARLWDAALKEANRSVAQSLENANTAAKVGDGVRYSLSDRITADMSDEERYELLKNKPLAVPKCDDSKVSKVDFNELRTAGRSRAFAILKKIGDQFGVFKEYHNEDMDIEFEFSRRKLQESVNKQGGEYDNYARMLSVFDEVIEGAIGIETHRNRYATSGEQVAATYVFSSAFQTETGVVPVLLEVREFTDGTKSSMHVVVSLHEIERSRIVVYNSNTVSDAAPYTLPASAIKIADLFKNVNVADGRLLKYIPDGFLNETQLAAKQAALAEQTEYIDRKNAKTAQAPSGEQGKQSVKGSRDLQKQIDALEYQNKRLKEQMKRTDIPRQNRKAVENTATALAKEYSSKIDRKVLADRLEELYDSIYGKIKNWSVKNSLTWDDIRAEARSIANAILDQSTAYASPLYREYGKLRSKIRNEALTIAAKDREELQYFGYDGYEDFKKRNAKRLTLTEDGRSVESLYRELNEENSDLFPDDMFTPAEQLNRISEVLTDLDALARDPYAFNREQIAKFLAGEIEERFYQTERKELTFADKEEQKRQRMRQSDKRLFDAELYAVGRRHERELKAVQQNYAEANRKRIENQNAAQRRETIYRHANRLANKLLRPTNKQHVPEDLRGAAYNLLKYINLESGFENVYGKDAKYHRVEAGTELGAEATSRTQAAVELKVKLEEMAEKESMTIDPDMGDYLDEIALMGNKTLQQMTRAELDTVWNVMQIVEHTISRANELHEMGRYETLSSMATALEKANRDKRERKDYVKTVGALDKLINFDMLSPETFFHKLGKPGDEIYRMMRKAADRQTGIYNEGVLKAQKLVKESGVDFAKLDKELHTFDFSGKRKITLSRSQIMDLYALSKREQAKAHIVKGGLKPVGAAKGIVELSNAQPISVSWYEVEQIISKLTDKEKKLMDGLQSYLSNELSKHGNEETMKVYGYKKFKEKFYWPIKVSGTEVKSDPTKAAHAKTIPGYGMTKNIKPKAKNPVELRSAIDTFSTHLNQMATYAAWLGTNEDITRLINYQYESVDNDTENTVKRILATVYGKNGEKYINDLLSDIAQGTKAGQDRTLSDNLTSQWKAAKVGGNLRVIVQQPTAILRAMTMLDPKYMVANVNAKAGWEKAKKYAPIAQWKDWGYFEIGTGRSLRELITGTEHGIDKVKNSLMWAAGAMDSVSWGYLWNAVERETADKHPNLVKGSENFYKTVADRFSEIVDRTQVVDSVLHRTQIMRSGNALNKMATSFMSEPSKIYNMVARDLYDIVDADSETAKKRAYKALRRSSAALITSFAVNALMQSLVDALRDDDRDKKYWEKFAENYFGITGDEESFAEYHENFWSGNFWQNFNPFSYVPYVKDVLSIAQGYEVDRSDMAAISDLANALQQLWKSISGEGQKTILATGFEAAAKLGDLLGIPVSNLKREAASAINTALNELELYDLRYELDKIIYNEGNATGVFFGDLYRTMNNDYDTYEDIYEDMYEGLIERGYEEDEAADKISDAMENKMKKDLGVESVKSLPVRYTPPTSKDREDPFLALMKKAREKDTGWVEQLDPGSIEIALAVDEIRDQKVLEKIKMVAFQPYGEDLKRLAMRNIMGDSQWTRYLSALNGGVSSMQYAEFLEDIAKEAKRRTGKEDANPSQADVLAVLKKSKLSAKQKQAIWNGYGWKSESPW